MPYEYKHCNEVLYECCLLQKTHICALSVFTVYALSNSQAGHDLNYAKNNN